MATLSLKISLDGGKVVKTIQFDPTTTVYDACRIIREKILEANHNDPKDYGLFLASEEDNKKGIWLEASRSLDYYMLRNGDLLEYNKKTRNLRVRMLDGTVKTLLVDDSQIVANLMVVICTKIGITNYDEYGLVREEQKEEADPSEKPNYGTLTLKRRHQEKERDAKMEQLRKKLRTDDEVNWVEGGKTLREQGVEARETLLLRRRLFFSDRNVDSRDPLQLTLLYVQARDAILAGAHPTTHDKACEFAGIQCQIQFGDHKEDKHTTGFLDLKEFLPASYVKVKGIEKKVFREHRKHAGLSELDAKVLYTKSARDLKTYGVAFFLVKEKMKGKNKLVPRLLGVTKDSVLRLDEKTKEVLQTWPLTTVRRWCASPNTFTLDFGDYSDQYYSVQTTEAEQILQVIAGYIDIIVKKRRAKDHVGLEGDEGSAMLEDSVSPSKANIIQHDTFKSGKVNTESVAKPAVMRPGAEGAKSFALGVVTGAQQTTVGGQALAAHAPPTTTQTQQTKITTIMTEPQRALLSTISSGREVIKQTEEGLTKATLPELGNDAGARRWRRATLDSSRQTVTSHIAAMNAATAQVVTLTAAADDLDHSAVGAAISTIATNLPEMTKGVQMIAALMEEPGGGDKLLDATRALCCAFTDLLKAAEPHTKEPRQNLLNAASRVGEASTSVLHTIGEETEEDKETQDILLSLAKAVANTTAALVLKAKNVAAQCKDEQPLQNTIIAAATHCALATSQLVACAKVVAPTLHSSACREQLAAAARQVAGAVQRLSAAAAAAPPATAPAVHALSAAAHRVSDELERLLAHCQLDRRVQPTVMEQSVETVLCASERVTDAPDAPEMVRRARLLGQATARLIADIKTEAEKQPSEAQRKLLAAAKLLADATARMVEAARLCASEPQDRDKQEALRRAAEELRFITADYAQGQDIVSAQIVRLAESARQAASSATQLVTAAHNAAQYNTNKYSQESLQAACASVSAHCPRVCAAARAAAAAPLRPAQQAALADAADALLQVSGEAVQAARGAAPTVSEVAAARLLAEAVAALTASSADLRAALARARLSCKGVELDAALDLIQGLRQEFLEVEQAALRDELKPLPGHTAQWATSTLQQAGRAACSAGTRAAGGVRARDAATAARAAAALAAALLRLAPALRAAAALAPPDRRLRVISSGQRVLQSSQRLVEAVKAQVTGLDPDPAFVLSLAKDLSQGIEETLSALPSHAELDAAADALAHTLDVLETGELPHTDRGYGELQTELNSAAVELNSAASGVVDGVMADGETREGGELPDRAKNFHNAFDRLAGVCLEMAGYTEEIESRTQMVNSLKTVTINSSKLLGTAKSVSQDLNRPNAKNELAAAARAVTDSINHLVDVCTLAAPGQKECGAALLRMSGCRPLLKAPSHPLLDLGYFACLDAVVDHSKLLSEGMSGMAGAVKRGEAESFAGAVGAVAAAVQGLVECTAHAAYLVAVSDESSAAGRAGLVDQAGLARAALAIEQACQTLAAPSSAQPQVLAAATLVAKHTSALCHAVRQASAKCASPSAKRHFVQAAKDVANCTSALVKGIKALDADYSEENRVRCAAATVPLQEAVRSLRSFADSPEFAPVPAKISQQARDRQEPVLLCGRNIITESCAMVEAARALALGGGGAGTNDRAHWQALAHHSKLVSDTIKSLVTNIREKAPGQRECATALETLSRQLRELDNAALQALAHDLPPSDGNTLQGYLEQIENSVAEMGERLEPVVAAARSEAENLGHAVTQLVSYSSPLVQGSTGAASHTAGAEACTELLQHSRTVLETLALLLTAAQAAAGNPRASSAHAEVDAQASLGRAALRELAERVRELSTQRGAVGPLLDSVARALARLTEHRMSLVGTYDETDSFVDYQTRMVGAAKDIARLASDMTAKSATEPSKLVEVGNEMCGRYEALAADSIGASATTPNPDVANRLRACCVELGEAVSELVVAGGRCRLSAAPQQQHAVGTAARNVNEKVVAVLGALQAGSRGTQACIDAAATIATILGDLDTTILFASAGTLQSDKEGDTFSNHRELILQTAKRLVEDTKTLVGGAAGGQDQLAAAAQSAVSTIVHLCEVVKAGATSLSGGGAEPQVLVLHAARDAAAALRDLAAATAAASGKHLAHPDMQRLKHAAKRLSNPKRWSLPINANTVPRSKRRSVNFKDCNSCDSETDIYQSDQEEELIKLLDYSSHDDDVSPTIFYDSCEEMITYIESRMSNPPAREQNDDVNARYNLASRNSLFDMDWRVVKYGETIFLGELRKLVDLYLDSIDKAENRKRRRAQTIDKVNSELDTEMKRLSQVMDDLDWERVVSENITTTETDVTTVYNSSKRPKLDKDKAKLKSPVFKVKKVKPINLIVNLEVKSPEIKSPKEKIHIKDIIPIKDGGKEVAEEPKEKKNEFWKLFRDDTEWWKALAKRNLEKMEETRRELERFSGHELVLGEIKCEIDKYDKEKETLQSFIEEVDRSQAIKKDLEYDQKYEDMVLKLIEFAKKDFIYKGFDPLIEQLKTLSSLQIEGRKKKVVNIEDIINVYTKIDISKYTYEELCLLEKYYKEMIRKYKSETRRKENLITLEMERDKDTQSAPPTYHRNVILNLNTQHNLSRNLNHFSTTTISQENTLKRTQINEQRSENNLEIFDLTRTYPIEYYANNWWRIYEDILKNREQQYGSIDNWWKFYQAVLNKEDTNEEVIRRIRCIMEDRERSRRPNSRMEEQLRMLDDIQNSKFHESEEATNQDDESVMVTNVTSLLKTVKAVEDEDTRGNRALESTIEAISQEIEVLISPTPPKNTASVEEMMRCTRLMTAATARAVSAAGQDQLVAAANLGRRTVLDMLAAAKGAAHAAETEELRTRTLQATRAAALAYRALLGALLAGARHALPEHSRAVASAVADMLAAADCLKGSEWVDPADPTVIAEQELLGAAASIDAAARKLDALRPRTAPKTETNENLNFDEMILEAAKSIIAATSALVRAASAAQRELIDQGKVARRPTSSSDDGQWSEGLVSAARLVAAAAHALAESANALVQGAASEERLISSARQVASSTAQLLVACKVKAEPSSESTRRLQAAGAEVIRSTDNLVRAARDAIACDDERSLVLNRRMVGGIAQEIDARSEVLRIEKELEEARGRLTAIRQAKYKLKDASATSGDETDDHVGYSSDASHTHTVHRFKTPNSSFANTTYSPNSTYSAHNATQNTTNVTQHSTNISQHVTNLSQSVHGTPTSPTFQHQTPMSPTFNNPTPTSPAYGNLTPTTPTHGQNGYQRDDKQAQSLSFSSFRPQEDQKQNYEGFTTRDKTANDRTMTEKSSMSEETIVVKSLQLPEVRMALLIDDRETEKIYYKREKPPPPPRRASLLRHDKHYETRLYDTPRPINEHYSSTDEQRHFESSSNQYYSKEQKYNYEGPKAPPMSPKFNARELKFDETPEPIYSTLKKPSTMDGFGQSLSEHQKSTEATSGGTKHSEYSVKSESYQSYPKNEFFKTETRQEVKSPFATSTPSKFEKSNLKSTDMVKVPTPDYDRISSPYGKDVHSYGGPNFFEETTTEVKEIPNGTQKITTTKIYSSSPVNLTTTNTKYEPIKLEGIDELTKFDSDSRYSTLDSRFNTLDSKMSSDTSRSFMRPSEFQDFQSTTNVTKVKKPSDLVKEIDSLDKKFSKQTITSETIEKKSVMTSSHKSETSSTVTKKFGNF